MRVKALVTVLGKVEKTWVDKEGVTHPSFSVNIMQESGQIVESIRLNAEQYKLVEANKVYTIFADYGTSKNGAYLKVIDIAEGTK